MIGRLFRALSLCLAALLVATSLARAIAPVEQGPRFAAIGGYIVAICAATTGDGAGTDQPAAAFLHCDHCLACQALAFQPPAPACSVQTWCLAAPSVLSAEGIGHIAWMYPPGQPRAPPV